MFWSFLFIDLQYQHATINVLPQNTQLQDETGELVKEIEDKYKQKCV